MASIWRGKTATLSITDSSDADVPVGQLQDVEVRKVDTTTELRASGSTKRQDVMRTETEIRVTGTVSAWDIGAFEILIDYDSTSDSLNDTYTPPLFTVEVTIDETGGTTSTITVSDVYFEEIPISGAQDEYINMDLDGTGKDITIS